MSSAYHTKSDAVRAICAPRWGNTPSLVDPCATCPLMRPCVLNGVVAPEIEAFNKWIDGINDAAEALSGEKL